MKVALWTIAAGVAIYLARRRVARAKAERTRTFGRAYDEDALAWWYGVLGVMLAAFGAVFLVIALR